VFNRGFGGQSFIDKINYDKKKALKSTLILKKGAKYANLK